MKVHYKYTKKDGTVSNYVYDVAGTNQTLWMSYEMNDALNKLADQMSTTKASLLRMIVREFFKKEFNLELSTAVGSRGRPKKVLSEND